MTTRSVIVLVVVTAALSGLFSFSVAAGGLHRGPAGDAGPAGPEGPRGPAGTATVSAARIQRAIEDDPARVADALRGELGLDSTTSPSDTTDTTTSPASGGDVQQQVGDLSDTVDELRRKLDDLCADLRASSLTDSVPSCG